MTTDPRLAALLADPKMGEAAKKYDDAMKVVFASFANEEGRAGSPHEGVIDRADDAWRGLFVAILAASDRWEKEQDTVKVCRMCFTEPPNHAEGCDYTNLVRVK